MSLSRTFRRLRGWSRKGKKGSNGNGNGGHSKIPIRQNKIFLEPLEPRLLLSDMSYSMGAAGAAHDVTLRMQNENGVDTVEVVDNATSAVVASQSLADTGAVVITGGGEDDKLTVDFTNPFSNSIMFTDASGSDQDSLEVIGGDTTWNISGSDEGNVDHVNFSGIENLSGGPENKDIFIFGPGGSLNGKVDGGSGGFDSLIIDGNYNQVVYAPTGPDSGMISLDGKLLNFSGMEPTEVSGTNITIEGALSTFLGDQIELRYDPNYVDPETGNSKPMMVVDSLNNLFEDVYFDSSVQSVVIDTMGALPLESETVTVSSLAPNWDGRLTIDTGGGMDDSVTFTGGDIQLKSLMVTGNQSRPATINVLPDTAGTYGDPASEYSITASEYITFQAENSIAIGDGVTLSAGGDINLSTVSTIDLEWSALTPYFKDRESTASITIGDATLSGTNVSLTSQADSSKFAAFIADLLGISPEDAASLLENVVGISMGMSLPIGSPSPILTFTHDTFNPDTIVRDTGSWLSDGFEAGQMISVAGTANNNGDFLITYVDDTTIVVDDSVRAAVDETTTPDQTVTVITEVLPADLIPLLTLDPNRQMQPTDNPPVLTFDAPDTGVNGTITRDTGSWIDDGFGVDEYIWIKGTVSNDGIHKIADISDTTLTLAGLDIDETEGLDVTVTDETAYDAEVWGVNNSLPSPITTAGLLDPLVTQANLLLENLQDTITDFQIPAIPFIGVNFQGMISKATSTVTVGSGALITGGNVTIGATATSNATLKTPAATIAATYARSEADASAIIQDGATINATGNFSLTADVSNTLDAETLIVGGLKLKKIPGTSIPYASQTKGPAIGFTYGKAVSDADAGIAAGAIVSAGNIAVESTVNNNFTTNTDGFVCMPKKNMGQGISVTYSDFTSSSEAYIDGTATATGAEGNGNVVVDASSVNETNSTKAKAYVKRKPKMTDFETKFAAFLAEKQGKINSSSSNSTFSIAAGVAVALSSNTADAHIGDGASITADGNVTVNAFAQDPVKIGAYGASDVPATLSIAGAFNYGDYLNHADAYIGNDAVVESDGAIIVHAQAVVPNVFTLVDDILDIINGFKAIGNAFNWSLPPFPTTIDWEHPELTLQQGQVFFDAISTNITDTLTTFLAPFQNLVDLLKDYKHFVMNRIASSYTQANAKPEYAKDSSGNPTGSSKAAISASVNIFEIDNAANAWVGERATVRGKDTDKAASLEVTADASIETINIGGMASPYDLITTKGTGGSSSEGAAIGGTYNGVTYDNSAKAWIDDGANITVSGNVDLAATTKNWIITVTQAGGDGEKIGISGAFSWNQINGTSLAYIEDTARVTAGGDVKVNADNTIFAVTVGGVVQAGGNVAIGVGVGLNEFDMTTKAFIGNYEAPSGTVTQTGAVSAGGILEVKATSDEKIFAISVAGTKASPGGQEGQGGGDQGGGGDPPADDDPLDGVSLPTLFQEEGGTPDSKAKQSSGIGISGDATVNLVSDDTQAFIAGDIDVTVTNDITISAETDSLVVSVAGAVVLNTNTKGLGIAGSFDMNEFDRTTKAYIEGASVTSTAGDISIDAKAHDLFVAVAAGAAGAKLNENTGAVSGSVNLDLLDYETKAFIGDGSVVSATEGDISLAATTDIDVISVAGAIAVAGKAGIGASAEVSIINNAPTDNHPNLGTSAYIGDADVTSGGNISITSSATENIVSVAASIGIGSKKLGASGSVSSQNINTDLSSYIGTGAVVRADGSLLIDSRETTKPIAVAGGVAIGKSLGVGLSLSNTNIDRDVNAYIDDGAVVDAYALGDSLLLGDETVNGIRINATTDETLYGIAAAGSGGEKFALEASATVNTISSTTQAYIGDAGVNQGTDLTPDADQSVKVTAGHDTFIVGVGGGLAISGKVGVGASVDTEVNTRTVKAYIADSASVKAADDVVVDAWASLKEYSVAATAAVAYSGNGIAVEGSVSAIVLNNTVSAYIGNGATVEAGNDVLIAAEDELDLIVVDAGVAGGGSAGIGGSVAVITDTNTVSAYIGNGAIVTADGNVGIQALSDADIVAIAGSLSIGGKAGIGISNTTLVRSDTVQAYVGASAQITASGTIGDLAVLTGAKDSSGNMLSENVRGLSVAAISFEDLLTVAAGGAGGGTAGVAGSATVNVLTETTQAWLGQGAQVTAAGVRVKASDETDIKSIAGAVAFGGTAGVGGGVDVEVLTKTTEAYIGKNADVDADANVSIIASSSEDILSIPVSGAIGGTAGIAGSFGVSVLSLTTKAYVEDGTSATDAASISAGGSVAVLADDKTEIDIFAGNIAGGGTVGVGIAAAVPVVIKTVDAYIGAFTYVDADAAYGIVVKDGGFDAPVYTPNPVFSGSGGNVIFALNGTDADTITRTSGTWEADGYKAGQAIQISGSDKNDGTFVIESIDGATLYLKGGENVQGLSEDETVAGSDLTIQMIADENGAVVATPATETDMNDDGTSDFSNDDSQTGRRSVAASTRTINGVAVTAVNQDTIRTYGLTGGAAGTVAVNVGGDVQVSNITTRAYVASGANIDTEGSVLVGAGNDYETIGVAAGISISGTVSVTPSVVVAVTTLTTKAYIDDGATVDAAGDIVVKAKASEDILSIAAGVAGSGMVSVGGSIPVTILTTTTRAFIGEDALSYETGAKVTAGGNILVSAQDDTDADVIGGSLGVGIGAVGIGASVGVTVITKDTEAFVGDYAQVDARANTSTALDGIYTGEFDSNGNFVTETGFKGLAVQAASSEDLLSIAAAGAGGFYAGIAGGVTVEVISSDTRAYVGEYAKINTTSGAEGVEQSVNLTALDDAEVLSIGGGVGIGIAGIGGGVDVGILRNDTAAFIGDNSVVEAQKDLDINALSVKEVDTFALSVGGGVVGVAGSVSVWTIGGGLQSNYTVDEGEDSEATVDSLGTGNDSVIGFADKQAGGIDEGDPENPDEQTDNGYTSILSGFLGNGDENSEEVASRMSAVTTTIGNAAPLNPVANSVAAPVPTLIPDGTAAFIGANASVTAGGDVGLRAEEHLTFDGIAGNIAGGVGALGASIVIATVEGNVEAYIDNGATVMAGSDTGDDILVRARFNETLNGSAYAGQVGAVSLGAQVVVLTEKTDVRAYVDQGANINRAGGTLQIEASSDRDVTAFAAGGAYGAVTIGAAVAVADVGGSVEAFIGDADVGQAGAAVGSVAISATSDATAETEAVGVQAGIAGGVSAVVAAATVDPTVTAAIMAGAAVTATGDITVQAISEADAQADAIGVAVGGGLSVGVSVATAMLNPTIIASIGNSASVSGNNVTVRARNNRDEESNEPIEGKGARANAIAGSGAAISAAGASATADASTYVSASVGQATITANGGVKISADSYNSAETDNSGVAGGAISASVMVSDATVGGSTRAYAEPMTTISAGSLEVLATDTSTATADTLSIGIGAFTGAGAGTSTHVYREVDAHIGSAYDAAAPGASTFTITGGATIAANSTSTATTNSEGGGGGGFTVAAFVPSATIDGSTRAYVGQAATLSAGSLNMDASSTEEATANGIVVGVGGGAITVTKSTGKVDSITEAFVAAQSEKPAAGSAATLRITGAATVDAVNDSSVTTEIKGGGGGGITVNAFIAESTNSAKTRAYIGENADVEAGSLSISADGTMETSSTAFVVGIGAIQGSGASTVSKIDGVIESWIGGGFDESLGAISTRVDVDGGVSVHATSYANAFTEAKGGTGGFISVTAFLPKATEAAQTRAWLGSGVDLDASSLDINASSTWQRAEAYDKLTAITLVGGSGTSSEAKVEGAVQAFAGGTSTTLNVTGALAITADSMGGLALAKSTLGGGGIIAVEVSLAEASNTGSTQAWLADGTEITGVGSVAVNATSSEAANAISSVKSGGVIDGGGVQADATAKPVTRAWIGSDVSIDATGMVSVEAIAETAEADASATSAGGGAITVGVGFGTIDVQPTVQAWIGSGTRVATTGDVIVNAELRQEQPDVLPSDSLPHSNVNTTTDEITFANHGLNTGDVVTYDPLDWSTDKEDDTAPIGTGTSTSSPTLIADRDYGVIRINDNTIALGAAFDGAWVDTDKDVIVFDGAHNFRTGDAVWYSAAGVAGNVVTPGLYYVRVIDANTIKLYKTDDGPVTFNATRPGLITDGNRLNLSGLADGDLVTYRAPASMSFTSDAVDVRVNDDKLEPVDNNCIYIQNRVDTDGDGIPDADAYHGFTPGELVTYSTDGTPIGGLTNGATYQIYLPNFLNLNYVQLQKFTQVGSLQFNQVTDTYDTITRSDGGSWLSDGFAPGDIINIAGTGSNNTGLGLPLRIAQITDTQLFFENDVLTTEYVAGTTTISGVIPIQLDASSASGNHVLAPKPLGGLEDGMNYTVVNSSGGSFQLQRPDGSIVSSITVGQASGIHSLGIEGVALNPDGLTHQEGDEIALNHQLRLDLTSTTAGAINRLLGPAGVSLSQISGPVGNGQSLVTAKGGRGGAITVDVPTADAYFAADVQAYIDADLIRSGGDVSITTLSAASVSAYANSRSGGVIQVGEVDSWIDYNNFNNAYVGHAATGVTVKNITGETDLPQIVATGVQIEAAGDFKIASESKIITANTASGKGGGFVSVSDADASTDITSRTNTIIGSGATIAANTVDVEARLSGLDAKAKSEATAGGFAGGSNARADHDVNSSTLVLLEGASGSLSTITGREGMDVVATHQDFSTNRDADAHWYGLFGAPDTDGNNNGTVTNLIDADPWVVVNVGVRPTVGSPLDSFEGFDHLALLVKGNNVNFETDKDNQDVSQGDRKIMWDADVNVDSGPSPELVIGADGKVVRATDITVNGIVNPAPGYDFSGAAQIEVADIFNDGLGDVVFQAANDIDGGTVIDAPHYWGTFTFDQAFDSVRITNASNIPLWLNSIDPINTTESPRVHMDLDIGIEEELRFAINQTVGSTLIDVRNLGDSEVMLRDGKLINNPAGETRMLNAGGDIFGEAGSNTYLIRTRALGDANSATVPADFELEQDRYWSGTLQFVDAGAENAPDSLTISGTTWQALGFVVGDLIKVEVAGQTPQVFQIAALNGTTAVLNTQAQLSNQMVSAQVSRFHGIEAQGSVGTAEKPIRIESIYSPDQTGQIFGEAGTDLFLDLSARFRGMGYGDQTAKVDLLTAGNDTVVTLNAAVVENGRLPTPGVDVSVQDYPDWPHTGNYKIFYRPDVRPAGIEAGDLYFEEAVGVPTGSLHLNVDTTWTFGLAEAGQHVSISAADSSMPGSLNLDFYPPVTPTINVLGTTNIKAGGAFVDVLTNGYIGTEADPFSEIVAVDLADGNDLRVGTIHSTYDDVYLYAPQGIIDAKDNAAVPAGDDSADVIGNSIYLWANAGNIGDPSGVNDLEIDSQTSAYGTIRAHAAGSLFLTETAGAANVLLLEANGSDSGQSPALRFTVRESAAGGEDLNLLADGLINTPQGSILLRVGDDITTDATAQILAGHDINIYGDFARTSEMSSGIPVSDTGDPGDGTIMRLCGDIIHGPIADGSLTQIWGNTDADNIKFGPNYIWLGPKTIIYGRDNNDIIDARSVTNTGIIIFGNAGEDTIWGSQRDDLILGDNGWVKFGSDLIHVTEVWSDAYSSNYGISTVSYSAPVIGPTIYGGNDYISGEGGADSIIGGVGLDKIYGDKAGSSGGNDGQDILIGDNGRIRSASTAKTGQFYTFLTPVTSVYTGMDKDATTGGKDTIEGNAQKDLIIGGVGVDKITSDSTDIVFTENCSIIFPVGYMTAEGPAPVTASTDLLNDAELAPMVAQAIARWEEALGNDSQAKLLEGVQVAVADLPGNTLGVAADNTILIDINAAGYGWFIDPTPADNSEFTGGSIPAGMDLLTVVTHEIGHVLGLADVSAGTDIMSASLAEGVRLVPTTSEGNTQDRLVSLTMGGSTEKAHNYALEQSGNTWLVDFLVNWSEKNLNPNKDIAVII